MIEESEQLIRTTAFRMSSVYHVRVKPSRHASDRAPFKRVRTPHARPSVLKEPRAKVLAHPPILAGVPNPSQGGLPLEDTAPPPPRSAPTRMDC